MNKILESGTNFIWENARLLERAIFTYHFLNGSPARILDVLRTYQNDDGGFGNALEPDLRAPDSQPLFVEFALRTLYECNLRDREMAYQACEFLSKHANLEKGIPLVFPSFRLYPHPAHMDNPQVEQASMEHLAGLVGLVHWQGIHHPWLQKAVETCVNFISTSSFTDSHTTLNAFCLLEALTPERPVEHLFSKLSDDLFKSSFFHLDVPVTSYGLTPLTFAPTPHSYCRKIFSDTQIEAHLSDLEKQQQEDGGWPIHWDPPAGTSRQEWRAQRTVAALVTLHSYKRLKSPV
jgi:hypothetical protein